MMLRRVLRSIFIIILLAFLLPDTTVMGYFNGHLHADQCTPDPKLTGSISNEIPVYRPFVHDNFWEIYRTTEEAAIVVPGSDSYVLMDIFDIDIMPHVLPFPLKHEDVQLADLIYANIKIRHLLEKYELLQQKAIAVKDSYTLPFMDRVDSVKNSKRQPKRIKRRNQYDSISHEYTVLNNVLSIGRHNPAGDVLKATTGALPDQSLDPTDLKMSSLDRSSVNKAYGTSTAVDSVNGIDGGAGGRYDPTAFQTKVLKKGESGDLSKDQSLPWIFRVCLQILSIIARNKLEVLISGFFVLLIVLMMSSAGR